MTSSLRFKILAAASLMLAAASVAPAQAVKTLRFAVIGGSVASANSGYAARIGLRLPADSVINYAFGGGTVLKSGDSSYWTSGKLAQVLAYQPDIVAIQLGANDSKPVNWGDSAHFERDYKALIDTLASMPSQPRIILVYPTPVWKDETGPQSTNLLRGSVIANSIVPLVRKIAKDKGADTVDLYTPFAGRQTLFTDSINPATAAVTDSLGRRIFLGLVQQSIRVMCVGNSITQYTQSISGSVAKDAYSMRLNMMLGKKFWVWNGGRVGDWMQRKTFANTTYKSYITEKAWMDSLFNLKPQYITITLGTNDSRTNWWNTAGFIADYQYFIDTLYNNSNPKPKFFVAKPFPAWMVSGTWAYPPTGESGTNGINGDIIRDSVGPAVAAIAASRPLAVAGVIDGYTPMVALHAVTNTQTDGVHPNKIGQDTIAHIFYRAMQPLVTGLAPARAAVTAQQHAPRALRYIKGGARPQDGLGLRSVDGKAVLPQASGIYVEKPKAVKTPDPQ